MSPGNNADWWRSKWPRSHRLDVKQKPGTKAGTASLLSGKGRWADTAQIMAKRLAPKFEGEYAPNPVRTLEDMSEAEIQALEKQYGVPVRRPKKRKGSK